MIKDDHMIELLCVEFKRQIDEDLIQCLPSAANPKGIIALLLSHLQAGLT